MVLRSRDDATENPRKKQQILTEVTKNPQVNRERGGKGADRLNLVCFRNRSRSKGCRGSWIMT